MLFPLMISSSVFAEGYLVTSDLWIKAVINTVEKGPVDAIWQKGGEDTTSRGDTVIWGHFYASPSDVTWGSENNPDLFVKIWFDVSGRVDVNFFHVSVPDIEVYSDLPDDGTYDQKGTTTMANRYIRHEYWDDFSSAAIIADHQAAANFSNIPSGYFSLARSTFNIYYGHTSHGSQIITGMSMLENENANYGLPPIHETGPDLGYPTWEPKTREYLDEHPETNLVMWSWCGQLSGYSAEKVNNYLTKMNRLEVDYPNVTFIYMTGHLNGSGPSGTLYANNNQIRSFCRENSKILFDFADIESYDPDSNYYPDGGDACEWCSTWCNSHVCPSCGHCAHSHCFNCYLKGKAFWWLLARLSG